MTDLPKTANGFGLFLARLPQTSEEIDADSATFPGDPAAPWRRQLRLLSWVFMLSRKVA